MEQVNYSPRLHIGIRDGQARITGRNVKVRMVISRLLHGSGATIEEVMEQYNLTRSEVLSCLAYYFDYQDAIERHFQDQEEALHRAATPLDEMIARLRAQQGKGSSR